MSNKGGQAGEPQFKGKVKAIAQNIREGHVSLREVFIAQGLRPEVVEHYLSLESQTIEATGRLL